MHKMKREQKRLDERQKLQAKALNQAKEEQEKYLGDLERQHQRLVKEKMKVRAERGGLGHSFSFLAQSRSTIYILCLANAL